MSSGIHSKNMSKLQRHIVKNFSGGSAETNVHPLVKKFLKGLAVVSFLLVCGLFVWLGIKYVNTKGNTQETTEEKNAETTITTEDTGEGSDDGRETVNINVADSETTRTSGNRRSSITQRTENIESTNSVESSSCVNGVCD